MIINPYEYPFIVVEGIDGCGKGEQIERLKKYFEDKKRNVYFTKEPVEGEGKIGSLIRDILDNKGVVPSTIRPICDPSGKASEVIDFVFSKKGEKLKSEELQLLYIADRILHRNGEGIFLQHSSVVSDRDWESTLAYHIAFGGSPKWVCEKHEELFQKAGVEFFVSDLTLVIDITAEEAVKRQQNMGKKFDYFEDAVEKREKIRQAYLEIPAGLKWLSGLPLNIQIVDGMRPPKDVFQDALKHVEDVMKSKKNT